MATPVIPLLTYQGRRMDTSPSACGPLRPSADALGSWDELRGRLAEDGYLFLPGLLDRGQVVAARQEVTVRLAAAGVLDPGHPPVEAVARTDARVAFMPELARHNPPLDRVLYAGPMISFYEGLLGGPVRHFDYTWFRAKTPGPDTATQPHYDVVYMGRGTLSLYTSWTPLSDIPYEMGGLLVLEGSHRLEMLKQGYGRTDVDAYCEDGDGLVAAARQEGRELTAQERARLRWSSTGAFSTDAIEARQRLGGRWLTAEYRMGDVLVFGMHVMHASSDNRTERIRLSADSRYQLAAEPADERWIGPDPPAHGIRAKRATVC